MNESKLIIWKIILLNGWKNIQVKKICSPELFGSLKPGFRCASSNLRMRVKLDYVTVIIKINSNHG
jgi:hypothetical protein